MKIQEKKYNEERTVLTGMIVDRSVVARISSKWTTPMFRASWSDMIGQWCIDYFKEYDKAPGPHIQSIFEAWASDTQDKTTVKLVDEFLQALNNEYVKLRRDSNSDYVLDIAGRYFNKVRLERLADSIQNDLENGKVVRAENRINTHRRVELGVGAWINVYGDKEVFRQAFENTQESLIKYKDGLGRFFGQQLCRDGFIAVMAPDKRGKSMMLLDFAFRAVEQRRKVAFFEAGDLSRDQIVKRFGVRVARHPLFPCKVSFPMSINRSNPDRPVPHCKSKVFKEGVDWRKVWKCAQKFTKGRRIEDALRLSCHPNETLTIDNIRETLDEWENNGWIPDVVIIDYADILDMGAKGLEGRDRTDRVWKQMRRISQENHCLLITATQSDAAAYDAQTISRKHFSEDKRKNAHVTGMIGINQTDDEKQRGIVRLNWVVLREGDYSEKRCCTVATCMALANMAVCSYF